MGPMAEWDVGISGKTTDLPRLLAWPDLAVHLVAARSGACFFFFSLLVAVPSTVGVNVVVLRSRRRREWGGFDPVGA